MSKGDEFETTSLDQYDFVIDYHHGKINVVADALSRKATVELWAIGTTCRYQVVIEKKLVQQGSVENFSIDDNDCLRFCSQICVPNVVDLMELILHETHNTPIAMHPSGVKIYRDLQETYW
ncbi:integrase [Gossypium australe]|uniref:Integrase n=1 Tax=Gossypium australe TaxID=47621 RepID=A0A5B6VJY6_9ROSI|nr:integrase [Gossypium australe]